MSDNEYDLDHEEEGQEEEFPWAEIPTSMKGLRACKRCSLVKGNDQVGHWCVVMSENYCDGCNIEVMLLKSTLFHLVTSILQTIWAQRSFEVYVVYHPPSATEHRLAGWLPPQVPAFVRDI